jgi:hypothetical protein
MPKPYSQKKFKFTGEIDMFPQEFLDLRKETMKHPELLKMLESCSDLAEWFATVGTYADVVIDGIFDKYSLGNLSVTLTKALYRKRTSFIITGSTRLN